MVLWTSHAYQRPVWNLGPRISEIRLLYIKTKNPDSQSRLRYQKRALIGFQYSLETGRVPTNDRMNLARIVWLGLLTGSRNFCFYCTLLTFLFDAFVLRRSLNSRIIWDYLPTQISKLFTNCITPTTLYFSIISSLEYSTNICDVRRNDHRT